MIAAHAPASSWSRLAGHGRAAAPRQSRTATTTASAVQWNRKAMRYATKPAERGSPSAGNSGSANVQTSSGERHQPEQRSSRRVGGSNAVLKR